jgi:SAM-dependent methyltransferase
VKNENLHELKFTGERMIPGESGADVYWAHIYRYRFASKFTGAHRIADIASGEGYGTAALAKKDFTGAVIGFDISFDACRMAKSRYGVTTIASSAELLPIPDQSFDLIISFETIEHLINPTIFIKECYRVLTPGGKLIISTPNRDTFHRVGPGSEFHINEMKEDEFFTLLSSNFNRVDGYYQQPYKLPFWNPRSLIAFESFWRRVKGFPRMIRILQRITNPKLWAEIDKDPITDILSKESIFSSLLNPYLVTKKPHSSHETAVYIIIVAQK